MDKYPAQPGYVDVDTSIEAAASMENTVDALRARVLTRIGAAGPRGMTCDEVEIALAMRHQTASARIRELSLMGRLCVVGKRPTRSGRQAQVYIMAPTPTQLPLFDKTASIPPPMQVEPVLKWAGGKRWLIPHIGRGIWTRLSKTGGRYIEPFLGGGAIALWLGLGERMILNDACEPLVNLYVQLQKNPGKVAWALSGYCTAGIDEESYYRVRDDQPDDPIKRAAQMIYLNKLGFNGLHRVNKRGKNNVPYGDHSYRESVVNRRSRDAVGSLFPHKGKLEAVGRALAGADLRAGDFQPVLESACDGDVVYVDPPYHESFDAYTKERFDEHDQYDLAVFCREATTRGATVIASNRDCEYIREIYDWATIIPVAELRAINSDGAGRGRVGCVLVTNAPELVDG